MTKITIGKDKWMHAGANFIMALTAIGSVTFALGLCIGASLGKEYGDSKAPGNKWDWWDIVADGVGMIAGLFISAIVRKLFGI